MIIWPVERSLKITHWLLVCSDLVGLMASLILNEIMSSSLRIFIHYLFFL